MKKYTIYIRKPDARCKNTERLISTTVWERSDEVAIQREVDELHMHHYPRGKFRIEFVETTEETV